MSRRRTSALEENGKLRVQNSALLDDVHNLEQEVRDLREDKRELREKIRVLNQQQQPLPQVSGHQPLEDPQIMPLPPMKVQHQNMHPYHYMHAPQYMSPANHMETPHMQYQQLQYPQQVPTLQPSGPSYHATNYSNFPFSAFGSKGHNKGTHDNRQPKPKLPALVAKSRNSPSAEKFCPGCRNYSHTLSACILATDEDGILMGCPFCNAIDHILPDCGRIKKFNDYQRLNKSRCILLKRRNNKPPVTFNRDTREVPGLMDASNEFRPWTPQFALHNFAGNHDDSNLGDPSWLRASEIPRGIFIHPRFRPTQKTPVKMEDEAGLSTQVKQEHKDGA